MPIDTRSFTRKKIAELGLADDTASILLDLHGELADAYRNDFIALRQTVREQASALNRIQRTLALLVEAIAPEISSTVPIAIGVAADGEDPDISTVALVSDPIATGYSMSQQDLAAATGLTPGDISALVKVFKLKDDPDCALTVRKGKSGRPLVNFHPKAIKKIRSLLESPTSGLDKAGTAVVRRTRKRLCIKVQ